MPDRALVTSAEFIRNIGYWQAEALHRPVSITHHGRERLVLSAAERFGRALEMTPDAAGTSTELAAASTMHLALLENLEEGFIEFSSTLRIRSINRITEEFLGLAREHLYPRTTDEIFPSLLSSLFRDVLTRVLRTRKAEDLDSELPGGRFLSVHAFPLPDGVGLLFLNITEQLRLRHDVEEGVALASAMQHQAELGTVKIDGRGRIVSVSEQFSAWLGFAADELVGYRLTDVASSARRRELSAALERVLVAKSHERITLSMVGKRGETVQGELTLAPILSDFAPRGAVGIFALRQTVADAVVAGPAAHVPG